MSTSNTNQEVIKLDDTVESIFERFPQFKFKMITTLSSAGIKCAGEDSDLKKTLAAALKSKGADESALRTLVMALNHHLPAASIPLFHVTERAAKKIHELFLQEQKPGWGFKFGLKPGGCSGFEYDMRLAEQPAEDEKIYEVDSVRLFVADRDIEKLKHTTLDYQQTLMKSGFEIKNPNATGTCGCGVSTSF